MSTFDQGYALIVGVGGDLPGTVNDAEALADILRSPDRCGYLPNQVALLTEKLATRQHILTSLDSLSQSSNPNSTVIIYFSGHGYQVTSAIGTSYFLLPYEYDLANLPETCISGAEFTEKLRRIVAGRLLVLLDCCRAGGIGEPKAPGLTFNKSPLPLEVDSILGEGRGRVIIASSRENELSFAGKPFSAFTVSLIEALTGNGVDIQDGYVRVSDLVLHAREFVPFRTSNKQHPTIKFYQADNFVVAFYAAGAKEPQPLSLPFDPVSAAIPDPPKQIDLSGSIIGGTVVDGNLEVTGGSTFIGRNQVIIHRRPTNNPEEKMKR